MTEEHPSDGAPFFYPTVETAGQQGGAYPGALESLRWDYFVKADVGTVHPGCIEWLVKNIAREAHGILSSPEDGMISASFERCYIHATCTTAQYEEFKQKFLETFRIFGATRIFEYRSAPGKEIA